MTLHVSQAHLLKRQPDTPLGRRDALLVCLFLDQGLRCGEVHTLRVKSIDLEAGTVAVPGEKGSITHHLTADTLITAMAYQPDVQGQEYLFPGRVEQQTNQIKPMDQRALRERIREPGERLGIAKLTPRDLGLSGATSAKRNKTAEIAWRSKSNKSGLERSFALFSLPPSAFFDALSSSLRREFTSL
jgi:integrase